MTPVYCSGDRKHHRHLHLLTGKISFPEYLSQITTVIFGKEETIGKYL
jgi:hypothetical protein